MLLRQFQKETISLVKKDQEKDSDVTSYQPILNLVKVLNMLTLCYCMLSL